MSREVAGDVPLGGAAAAGNRVVSEPAFELLFSEIIAYTGAYVSHSAASHATDMLRAAEAGVGEGEGVDKEIDGGDGDSDANGALVEPSPASVGAGNQPLPVRAVPSVGGTSRAARSKNTHGVGRRSLCNPAPAVPVLSLQATHSVFLSGCK